MSDGDVVHHFVVGIPLAADRQPCRNNKQNPQREKNRAFGKDDKVSAEKHRLQPEEVLGQKRVEKKNPTARQRAGLRPVNVPWRLFTPSLSTVIQIFSPGYRGVQGRTRRSTLSDHTVKHPLVYCV